MPCADRPPALQLPRGGCRRRRRRRRHGALRPPAGCVLRTAAAKGLYDVMKTNLGPKGTIKMLVGGAGGGW